MMSMSDYLKYSFKREDTRLQLWREWKALDSDLPDHYRLLNEEKRKEFDDEVTLRMGN